MLQVLIKEYRQSTNKTKYIQLDIDPYEPWLTTMILRISILFCLFGYFRGTSSIASEVTFTLGPLGPIKGKTTQTKYYPDAVVLLPEQRD